LFSSRSIKVARPDADYAIFETEINRCRGEENRLVQLVICSPAGFSGRRRPARIEDCSRQMEASRIRKPPARLTGKGGN
jgi:hypothetical protein